jgi:hypothetical protein
MTPIDATPPGVVTSDRGSLQALEALGTDAALSQDVERALRRIRKRLHADASERRVARTG